VYIWLQLCQILTDFNNFCRAKTGKIYETDRAFTYLLLKESAAEDVIDVSLFAYDKFTLKNFNMLTKEDKTLIKKMSGNQKNTGWND